MRKMWLLPIIGTIGNFFSACMIAIFPLGIISFIAYLLLSGRGIVSPTIAASIVISIDVFLVILYQAYLFYLGASGKGTKQLARLYGTRPLNNEENEFVKPLIHEVLAKHNKLNNVNWVFGKDINLTIKDDEEISTISFGHNQVGITSGFLEDSSNEVFKSMLAYHLARLYFKTSVIDMTYYFVQTPTRIALSMLKTGNFKTDKDEKKIKKILLLPAVVVGKVVDILCNIVQRVVSQQEVLKSDAYVVKLGYADGLLSMLACTYKVKPSILTKFFGYHPEPKLRIENVKAILEQSK